MSPLRRINTRIGELLIKKGLITRKQLDTVLSIQRKEGQNKKIGQILLEEGYIDRAQLSLALAIQYGYPYISIKNCNVDPDVLSLIGQDTIKSYSVFPIDKIADILTIAMVNPLDKLAVDLVKKTTNLEIKVFLTTPEELEEMISRYFPQKQE